MKTLNPNILYVCLFWGEMWKTLQDWIRKKIVKCSRKRLMGHWSRILEDTSIKINVNDTGPAHEIS